MVLVDTSGWIRALAKRSPYVNRLDRLLSVNEVAGHDFVYGELVIGDKGGRAEFLSAYEQIYRSSTLSHRDVVAFVRARRLYGRGVGWIDVHLLASAIAGRLQLWTADECFGDVANELGAAYRLPAG